MLLEMHAHTSRHSSCSEIDPLTLVQQVRKKGLQGLIITEHHCLWSTEELQQLRKEAELDAYFLLLGAQEVETDIGHVLVYGADTSIARKIPLGNLRSQFPHAALVWAHPFRNNRMPDQEQLMNPLLDGIEIFSQNHTPIGNYFGLEAWHTHKFTAISGSDTHAGESAGVFPTQFDHPLHTIDDAAAEIKAGRCRPFFKEIPKYGSNIIVTEITIGTKGEDEYRNRIILKHIPDKKKWEKAKHSADIIDALSRNGFRGTAFRVPGIIHRDNNRSIIIEEGQRGKNLFELITRVNLSVAVNYIILAAQWLAKLHALPHHEESTDESFHKEEKRLASYEKSFLTTKNPHASAAQHIIGIVNDFETAMFTDKKNRFTLNHGDYHPKNIIIGQDLMHDETTRYISVIDFDSAMLMPPEFDIGYFLSQFAHQLRPFPKIREHCPDDLFIDSYMHAADKRPDVSKRDIRLFKLRANLSIASFLIKYGKGESIEMDELIDRSKQIEESIKK